MTPDLERLRKNARKLAPVFQEIEFGLIDDPEYDPWDLRKPKKGQRLSADVKANQAAMIATNELIAWFGRRAGGFVGLWRGPANHALVEAPIVELDSEGQYHIRAMTIPDYMVRVTRDGVFAYVRGQVVAAGFKVARSRDAIYASVDSCPDDPNGYRNELYYTFKKKPKPKKR